MTSVSDNFLPRGVQAVSGPYGLRLCGYAEPLIEACLRLRKFASGDLGRELSIGEWQLTISDSFEVPGDRTVVYSYEAWGAAAGVLIDVPTGGYRSPLDFGDVHFCQRSRPDIGISLLGVTRYELRRARGPVSLIHPPVLVEIESQLSNRNLGALARIGDPTGTSWVVDLVSLATGDIAHEEFTTGKTADEALAAVLNKVDDL